MSSTCRFLTIAFAALLALGIFAAPGRADVTGLFGTHFSLTPQTTTVEMAPIEFDIQNDLTVTLVISGLSTTLHSHFGIAGIEDIILTTNATLGALDIQAVMVFSRFAAVCSTGVFVPNCPAPFIVNNVTPINSALLFVKKRVTTTLNLGGVTFSNLAMFEDTSYPETLSATFYQTQHFAFGDVVTVTGATPSGIIISAQTGICATRTPNVIKKHAFPFEVNPDCATTPKPDILFDFERLTISSVPLAPGVTVGAVVNCVTIFSCSLTTDFRVSGGPVPFTATLRFTNLLSLAFNGATITVNSGAGTLTINITPTGAVAFVNITVRATLNPDTFPATLTISADVEPSLGITSAVVTLMITRAGLVFSAEATFESPGAPPAVFESLTFSLSVPGSLLSLETVAVFTPLGLDSADIWIVIHF